MEKSFEDVFSIELIELFITLKEKIWIIILATFIASVLGWMGTTIFMKPEYEASINLIVNAKIDTTENITNDNISSAQNLVNTYGIIIKSNTVLKQVIDKLGLDITYEELYEHVFVEAINSTQIMKISVRNENTEMAKEIVETICEIAPDIVISAVEAGTCKVISMVEVGENPVTPDIGKNTVISGLLGMIISIGIIVLREFFNDCIIDESDIERKLGISVLGVIPELDGE